LAFDPISLILNLVVLLVMPPLFPGIINRVKSFFAGRRGPSIFQLYFDIIKLLRKGEVYSRSTSLVFRVAPFAVFGAVLVAGNLLPLAGASPVSFYGDVVLFVYLFAFARFFIVVSSLDTASSFEGMGASRETAFGAFAELTVFVAVMTLAVITRAISLSEIFGSNHGRFIAEPSMVILFLAFFFILLTENSRMPVDDPNTHLELTMIHEVMILDHSGPDLAIMLYSSSIKMFIYMAFAVMMIFPNIGNDSLFLLPMLLLKIAVLSVVIGIVESVTARIRLIRIPQFLIASFVLSAFAFLTVLFMRGAL